MIETYRMLGREREAELEREAWRFRRAALAQDTPMRPRRAPTAGDLGRRRKGVEMFKRIRIALLFVLTVLAASAVTTTAAGANRAVVVPFEKHWVSSGHYVGSAGDGGTIEMSLYNVSFDGNIQKFSADLELSVDGRSLEAKLDGRFNFSTGRVVLNGRVTSGWLSGAQVHEESTYVGDDPMTGGPIFVGTVRLMPGSAG
jgi:hypothetical protein